MRNTVSETPAPITWVFYLASLGGREIARVVEHGEVSERGREVKKSQKWWLGVYLDGVWCVSEVLDKDRCMTTHFLVMDPAVHLLCLYQPLSLESPNLPIPTPFLYQLLCLSINFVPCNAWESGCQSSMALGQSWGTGFASGLVDLIPHCIRTSKEMLW